jgi:NIPSNAP
VASGNDVKYNVVATRGIALISFAAGSLITARLASTSRVRADSNRVFELRIFHAVPGKAPTLESRFRNTASKLPAKHGPDAVGYRVPEDAAAFDNTFVYILAHPSREEAKKNWDATHADPGFREMAKSEQADKLVEKVGSVYMRPTDFFTDQVVLVGWHAGRAWPRRHSAGECPFGPSQTSKGRDAPAGLNSRRVLMGFRGPWALGDRP